MILILLIAACIHEGDEDNPYTDGNVDNNDGSSFPSCAPTPSGAGYWENSDEDGLHCNYEWTESGEWAYGLNSSETSCLEASWAPNQNGGSIKLWSKSDNKGCDWVIPW